jgi:hypothetical protein
LLDGGVARLAYYLKRDSIIVDRALNELRL